MNIETLRAIAHIGFVLSVVLCVLSIIYDNHRYR